MYCFRKEIKVLVYHTLTGGSIHEYDEHLLTFLEMLTKINSIDWSCVLQ